MLGHRSRSRVSRGSGPRSSSPARCAEGRRRRAGTASRMTLRRTRALASIACAVCVPLPLRAQPAPAEAAAAADRRGAPFIAKLQQEIPARFGTVAAAEKAGYFQYTGEDSTGAISYVNLKVWNSIDLNVPNQLWYDVNGRLAGRRLHGAGVAVAERADDAVRLRDRSLALGPPRRAHALGLHRAPTARSSSARCRCRSSPTPAALRARTMPDDPGEQSRARQSRACRGSTVPIR